SRVHRRRRHHAGGPLPAHGDALRGVAAVALSGAALAQSVAVHVLLRFRRPARRRCLAGNPRAQGGRYGHAAADRGHARRRRAACPAGTVSGGPKVRAMEIIDELEPSRRGIYAGAVGYISFQGDMDVAIAIRTAVLRRGMLYAQVGAGIVHDSVPENEWRETLSKARAVLRAAEMAQAGLDDEG